MTKGLPASGKSTWAKQFILDNQGWKRVNKDDLRAMIDAGHWSKENEEMIVHSRDNLVMMYLEGAYNVIVDDTNFHPEHETRLKEIAETYGAEFEVKYFDTNPRICMQRDAARGDKSVGNKVILDMYFKYVKPLGLNFNPTLSPLYIFDIDGTVARMNGRSPYDMSKVSEDLLIDEVASLAVILKMTGLSVIFVSGRSEDARADTEKWLEDNQLKHDGLFMRKSGDSRADYIIKEEIYREHIEGKYNVLGVFDDRDQVIDLWRSLGIQAYQVNYGSF